MFERTKQFCDSFLNMGIPGFDLAVYKEGDCVLRHMGGFSDFERRIPMTGKERYNIYSCSKPITCTAALQLWEKGKFSLEDKLADFMPEFQDMSVQTTEGVKKAENPILIKHLFEMTAGFSYNLHSPELMKCREETNGRCSTRELMTYLAKEPLLFEPGDRWEYSLCHDILAALVEVVSGEKFEDYVKTNIFDVLEMKDSTFMLDHEGISTLAEQYRFENGKPENIGKSNPYKMGYAYASGGAGCISTVDDYIKFLEGLRKHILLKRETLAMMTTDRLSDEQKRTMTTDTHGYGLGVRCPRDRGIHTDFGWGGAAGAFLAVDMENGISIYYAQHMLNSPNQQIRNWIYPYVMAELFGKKEFMSYIEGMRSTEDYKYTF